jgi:hypothetical protein
MRSCVVTWALILSRTGWGVMSVRITGEIYFKGAAMKKISFNIPAVLVTVVMLASFVVPVNLAMPYAVSADPGIMRWDTVVTPGSENLTKVGRFDVVNPHLPAGSNDSWGSEVIGMVVSGGSNDVGTVVKVGNLTGGQRSTATSYTQGILWDRGSNDPDYLEENAYKVYEANAASSQRLVTTGTGLGPRATSSFNFDGTGLDANETIRYADYSQSYGDGRSDVALVTAGGAAGGRILIRSSSGWGGWTAQLNANGTPGNALGNATTSGITYLAVKFSPTYSSDSSVVVVYATDNLSAGGGATYYNIGYRDIYANATLEWVFPPPGLEVKNPVSPDFASPASNYINTVDLHLPSDFSGQSASLRRAYVSIDAYGSNGLPPTPKRPLNEDGIYRIDDSIVYVLMDTSNTPEKSIYSIAYFGTYASGKLMAGERMGSPMHCYRAHLVHRLAHHLSHTLLVPGAQAHYRRGQPGHLRQRVQERHRRRRGGLECRRVDGLRGHLFPGGHCICRATRAHAQH